MPTRRGAGLLAAALGLWIVSRLFGAPELQVAAVAILVLLATGALWLLTTSVRLRVDRLTQPARLRFGERGSVTLTVTNHGRRSTGRLLLHDRAPASLAAPPRAVLPPLRPGRRVQLSYTVHGNQRGVVVLGPLQAEFTDPFGVVVRRRELPGTDEVTVRPPVVALAAGLPLGGAVGGSGEGRPRPQPGGEDLAEVREYVRGDPLKAIHWATTAHRGRLMVRSEESPQDPRATVVLDRRVGRHRGTGSDASLETAIAVAASVTNHLADRRRAVAIVDGATTGATAGRTLDGWLDHLSGIEATDVDLRRILAPLITGSTAGGTLVAVVTPPDPADLKELVRAGRSASVRVAVLVDVLSHEPGRPAGDPDLVRAARGLRAAGWRVTTVARGDDLAARWTDLLHVPRASRVGV